MATSWWLMMLLLYASEITSEETTNDSDLHLESQPNNTLSPNSSYPENIYSVVTMPILEIVTTSIPTTTTAVTTKKATTTTFRSTHYPTPIAVLHANPFNSTLPLIELIALGSCLIFGIITNSLFILVLKKDSEIKNKQGSNSSIAAKHQSLALPSTTVFLQFCFVLDTLVLLFLALSIFPFHSPFFRDAPFLHLVLSMTSFSLLDVVLIASAWSNVALALDQVRVIVVGNLFAVKSTSSASSASKSSAVVVVVLLALLSFLLSIPSFILFQDQLNETFDGFVADFDHKGLLESHYQIWSKLALRYWLPLLLVALSVSVCIVALKRPRYRLYAGAVAQYGGGDGDASEFRALKASSDDHNNDSSFSSSSPATTTSPTPLTERSLRVNFSKTCVVKLLVYLFFACLHFVLTTILYLDLDHLDVFDVLKVTANNNDNSLSNRSIAHTVACLTSIILSLNSISSFIVFVGDNALVRLHLKTTFRGWCLGGDKI